MSRQITSVPPWDGPLSTIGYADWDGVGSLTPERLLDAKPLREARDSLKLDRLTSFQMRT